MKTIVESKCTTCDGRISKYHMNHLGTDIYVNLCWKDSTFDIKPTDHPISIVIQINPNVLMDLIHTKHLKIID